jgi:hypothetical protein
MDIPDEATLPAAAAGVVAHGLLNTMTVIRGAAELLRTEWDGISPVRRGELFALIELQAAEASQALVSIVQGLPPEALDLLEELSSRRDQPVPANPPRLRRRADAALSPLR